jgi:AraC family transcriptional regulator, L-rhamnose operon transcriptional activator RhaR
MDSLTRPPAAGMPELTGPARGAILRGAEGQDPNAPERRTIAPPMRREAGSRYFEDDSDVAIFVAHHYPTIGWHEHDFYELAVIATGRALHESKQGIIPIQAGTAVFIPPGVGHEYRGCTDLIVYNCLFRAELDEAELMWAFRDGHLSVLFNPDRLARDRTLRDPVAVQLDDVGLRTVLASLERIRLRAPDARTRTGQLANLLLALDVVATARRAVDPSDRRTTAPPVVAAALELLSHDLVHQWTLSELSRQMYVGRSHLSRTFAKYVGLPPMHYLARLRAERAAALLTSTDMPVASIGAAVGWADPPYFSRRFRAVFGSSPRVYRQRHRHDRPEPLQHH